MKTTFRKLKGSGVFFASLTLGVALLSLFMARIALAQIDSDPTNNSETFPIFKRAVEQLAEIMVPAELADFAIMRPVEFENVLRQLKSPEEKTQEALAEYAIIHPAEFEAATAKIKTPAQRALEAKSSRAILKPAEVNAELELTKDAVTRALEAKALDAILNPAREAAPPPMVPVGVNGKAVPGAN